MTGDGKSHIEVERAGQMAKNLAIEMARVLENPNIQAQLSVESIGDMERVISCLLSYCEQTECFDGVVQKQSLENIRNVNRDLIEKVTLSYGVTQVLKLSFFDNLQATCEGTPRQTLNLNELNELKSVLEDPDLLETVMYNRTLLARENIFRVLPSQYTELTLVKGKHSFEAITPVIVSIDQLLILVDRMITAQFSAPVTKYINDVSKMNAASIYIKKKLACF